ncbi:MAG: OmpA family protein [Saprospiraceae bacterium]|uniref:OmpA family protein n=1 Tax=Candidatus Opimibacter skivensis TaxID=2982028 RepID=A0A9D7SST4_9BACT|nr:OmpA family protein [Candidatus Opimibacter skivensis]
MKKAYLMLLLILGSVIVNPGCNTSNKTKGAVIGATAGAATGAILGKKNKAVAIIIGAAVGGVAGGLIGNYMDKQAAKIQEDLKGAKVERVGEGILITFDSGILFDTDKYSLKSSTQENLKQLAPILLKYDDTNLKILGHTDNTGTDAYNKTLSDHRADAVNNFLVVQGVEGSRMTTTGYGESDPLATNDTEVGRTLNRRVEVVIVANKKLQRAAKKGDLVTK